MMNIVYLYLLSPLHTGGTTQEGNLLGIARESHTDLPYIPSSSIRGRLRALASNQQNGNDKSPRHLLFGNEIEDGGQLEQGAIWIGDASILWLPVPSLSHGVIWISCPLLLQRWARIKGGNIANSAAIPQPSSTNVKGSIYLKDAIFPANQLRQWDDDYEDFIPPNFRSSNPKVMVLEDQHCAVLIQMSLWRQVKIKLDEHKTVDGGFRYEEAIPPDTVMYFTWGTTSQAMNGTDSSSRQFQNLLSQHSILQIGGQESLGRGFVELHFATEGGQK